MVDYSNIFILGLDGLEHDFVEKWHLNGLQQHKHGKITVPFHPSIGHPGSPEVWASFLTGKWITYKPWNHSRLRELAWRILAFLRRYIEISLGLGRKFRGILRFPTLNEKTFLDHTISAELNAPYYSFDYASTEIMHRFTVKIRTIQDVRRDLYRLFSRRKKQVLNAIRHQLPRVNVFFAYIHIPDNMQHFFFSQPHEIENFYRKLNGFVSYLKTVLSPSTLFLIVSDHGFNLDTQLHSLHGFYSTSHPLNPEPTRITDFYPLILDTHKTPDALSIIIPTLKTLKTEIETVKSLPTCPVPHELIITRNHGIGHARNCGAQKASHPLLVFLDDDLRFGPALWPILLSTEPNEVRMAAVDNRPCSRVLAIYKTDFSKIGGFNENIKLSGEDTDFQLRAEDKGFTISIIPHGLIHHNDHESRFCGFNGIRKEVETARLFIRYGRRYGPYRRRFISSNIKYLKAFRLDLLLVKFAAFIYNIFKRCFHLL